jgi:glycosyltransferase involved in cell wall biosynthesis
MAESAQPSISVIICTHNPRADFLTRTLAALREQTLSLKHWELLVVDNASSIPVAPQFDISWHSSGRHILEPAMGLTTARLRGILEARGKVLVFVDDDNVVDADYLEQCRKIAAEFPQLGAWGGQCRPDFIDGPPEDWTREYWPIIGVNSLERDYWTNSPEYDNRFIPIGAGLVVRKVVAEAYRATAAESQIRRTLDRRGKDLTSNGDTDLALTACDSGYGVGRFLRLRLTHIIPEERLSEDYLCRLIESIQSSAKLLKSLRGPVAPEPNGLIQRCRRAIRMLLDGIGPRERRLRMARHRGRIRADKILEEQSLQDGHAALANAQHRA